MKKTSTLLLLSSLFLLVSCGGQSSYSGSATSNTIANTTTNTSVSEASTSEAVSEGSNATTAFDFASYQSTYGNFAIDPGDYGSYTYDESSNTYTLAVASEKAEYTLSGAFQGNIVIDNPNNLTAYKGVKITFNKAAVASLSTSKAAIYYKPESKNVEIKAQKGTVNYLLNLGSSEAVYSNNNIEFSGKGNLNVISYPGSNDTPHTFEAEGDITFTSAIEITVDSSAHDAFHGKHLLTVDDSSTPYSGTVTVNHAASQAFDFETSSGNGSISLLGGAYVVRGATSVFKVDASLEIGQGVNVTATNLSEDPIVLGEASSSFLYNNQGAFTVDGASYTYSSN